MDAFIVLLIDKDFGADDAEAIARLKSHYLLFKHGCDWLQALDECDDARTGDSRREE